jgi:hypothetical protein
MVRSPPGRGCYHARVMTKSCRVQTAARSRVRGDLAAANRPDRRRCSTKRLLEKGASPGHRAFAGATDLLRCAQAWNYLGVAYHQLTQWTMPRLRALTRSPT